MILETYGSGAHTGSLTQPQMVWALIWWGRCAVWVAWESFVYMPSEGGR